MAKRLTLVLAVALLVLFTAGAIWGARLDPKKTTQIPVIRGDESFDYLMSAAPGVFLTTILSPYDTVIGYTWYDYQHNSRIPRMNANDYQEFVLPGPPDTLGNGRHYVFMHQDMWGVGAKRYVNYAYWDPPDGWTALPAEIITKQGNRAGYTGMVLMRDSRAVAVYHTTEPVFPNTDDMGVAISIEPTDVGAADFAGGKYWFDIPDSVDFEESTFKGMWPAAGVDSLSRIHIVFNEGATAAGYSWLGYVRCQEIPAGSLMCMSPGKDSVTLAKEKQYFDRLNEVAMFGESGVTSDVVATSKVSNKVALIWPALAESEEDSTLYQIINDIFYIESTNGGDDWFTAGTMPTRINVTNYDSVDLMRAYGGISAVYDLDDSLHIFFHTHFYNQVTDGYDGGDVALWHWSKATERVCNLRPLPANKISQAKWDAYPGAWNRLIAKIQSGVGILDGDNKNYLYVQWTQFNDSSLGNLNDDGNQTQGEIYATVSTDGGATWNLPVNVTNSNVADCAAGDCASDHWSTLAERVDTALYMGWVYDLDAGGTAQDEGEATNSPYLVYALDTDSIPIEDKARIGWTPSHFISPYVHVPKNGVKKVALTIENLGTATLSSINLSSAAAWLTIGPYAASINAGACPTICSLTVTGQGAEEFYVDSIHVTSNDQAGNNDFYVRLHVVMSDVYVSPQFTVIGNPLFYLNESNVGNLANTNDTAGMYLYGDANEPNFLYDGSPLLAFTTPPGDSVVGRYIFNAEYFIAETDVMVDTSTDLKTIVVEAEFNPVTPQVPLPWHHAWWFWTIKMKEYIFYSAAPGNNAEQYLALKIIKLYYNPPPPWWPFSDPLASVPVHYLGMGLDMDVLSDSGAMNHPGSYDDTRRMSYIQGYGAGANENYRMGIAQRDKCYDFVHPLASGTACWPDPNILPQKDEPYCMWVLRNDSTVYPFPDGYGDENLYKWMSTPGDGIQGDGTPTDYNIVTTGKVIPAQSFPVADTYSVAYALVITDEYGPDKMNAAVDMVQCGNVNRDGSVTIADVVYFISYLFKGGPEIWTYMGDTNGDGVSDITDCVYLINYLFKSGPPPQCSSM